MTDRAPHIAHTPIAICGAGPVGQALALMLHQRGVAAADIVLLDGKTALQASQDVRSIALSHGSRQILQAIQAWPIRSTEIRQIHVSRRGHFGRCLISADDYQLPALGYVARYGDIITPLQQRLEQQAIAFRRPVLVNRIAEQDDQVLLTLDDETCFTADVAIQAEGGTFNAQQQKSRHHDYQQTAIIAHITSNVAAGQRAFERFTDQGPLALLPQDDGYALVWCVRPAMAETLMGLDNTAFLHALQHAFGDRTGTFKSVSPRHTYPLGLNAQAHASARLVTIGNAAQTLHPVAGQGLNLGLRDALALAKCLTSEPIISGHCGKHISTALASFTELRQADRNATIRVTDGMARVFASAPDGALSQSVLGFGLGMVDMLAPAKKMLAEQMMYGLR